MEIATRNAYYGNWKWNNAYYYKTESGYNFHDIEVSNDELSDETNTEVEHRRIDYVLLLLPYARSDFIESVTNYVDILPESVETVVSRIIEA